MANFDHFYCSSFIQFNIFHFIIMMISFLGSANGMENGNIEINFISGKELKVIMMKVCNGDKTLFSCFIFVLHD